MIRLPCCSRLVASLLFALTFVPHGFAQDGKADRQGAPQDRRRARPVGDAQRAFSLPDSVRVERDIVYAQYGERKVLLDLYLPKEKPEKPLPCIVVIHGGGWRNGSKQTFARHAAHLAEQGFAAACIGYRLLPEVEFPAPVMDCKAAVRWVRANAAKHGIDPDRIGAIGGSAGGHLVAMLGTSHKAVELEGDGGNAGVSSRVQAVVAMAAPADMSRFAERTGLDEKIARIVSPVSHLDKEAAPMLLLHGERDNLVPMAQSELLLSKCRGAGVKAELVVMKDGVHAFWNQNQWFGDTMDRAVKFFRETLR